VAAAQRRTRRRMPRLMTSNDAGVQGACPFSGALSSDDAACVLDALTSDPRVSSELAVNLVMALFRTGIDSVCLSARFFCCISLAIKITYLLTYLLVFAILKAIFEIISRISHASS